MKITDAITIAKNIIWAAAGIITIIWFIGKLGGNKEGIFIDGKTEANILSPFTNGQLSYGQLLTNVNLYRTNEPWISISNHRIWSGLADRNWSIEYNGAADSKLNEAGILFGSGWGAYYQRTIFDSWTIGVELMIDKDNEFEAYGKIGHKW